MNREAAESLMRNVLHVQGMPDELPTAHQEFLDLTLDSLVEDRPVMIPVVAADWAGYYAVARSLAELENFRDLVASFCDQSFAHVAPGNVGPDEDDAVIALLREHGYGHMFRVSRVAHASPHQLLTALTTMELLRRQRPPGLELRHATLGRLLREFEWALDQRDSDRLDALLRELALNGGMSEDNLRFAEVRRYAALSQWEALWSTGLMQYLLAVDRPVWITDLLLTAIWYERLARHGEQMPELARTFREEVLERFSPLFTSAGSARSPEAKRVVLLYALHSDPPRVDLVDSVAQSDFSSDPIASLLLAQRPLLAPSVDSAVAEARLASEDDQHDRVIALLRTAQPTAETAILLMRAAFAAPDTEPALVAYQHFLALPAPEQNELLGSPAVARMFAWVSSVAEPLAVVGAEVPGSWLTWLEVLEAEPTWPDALTVARESANAWSMPEVLREEDAEAFSVRVIDAPAEVREVVSRVSPHLLNALADHPAAAGTYLMLQSLFQLVVLDEQPSADDLALAAMVLPVLLSFPTDAGTYSQLLADVESLWREHLASYEHLDWALEVADSLARMPCPDQEARIRFLTSVSDLLRRSNARLLPTERTYAQTLLTECDASSLAPPDVEATAEDHDATDIWSPLNGQTLGLHCLYEPIVRRFREALPRHAPGVRIEVDASHDCSPRLKAVCSAADVLVVVTQHAKHAATDCIERNASIETRIVKSRANRVGFTGVLRALQDHLEDALASSGLAERALAP